MRSEHDGAAALTNLRALEQTLERVNQVGYGFLAAQAGDPEGDGWVAVSDLIADPDAHLPEWLEQYAATMGTDDRRVVSSFFFKTYANQLTGIGLAALLLERRVPDLSAGNVKLHIGESGGIDGLALVSPRFAALPDDPVAGNSSVTILPDQSALRDHLLATMVDEHLAPALDALRPCLALGRRALWGTAADTIAGIVILFAKQLDDPQAALDEIPALLGRPGLQGASGALCVEHEGRVEHVLQRAVCCFAYRLDQYPNCPTCPLLSREEQMTRIHEYLATT